MTSLVEGKKIYMRRLEKILSPEIYSGFKKMRNDVEVFCRENKLKEVVSYFQKDLEKVSKWSKDRLVEETMRIQSDADCDYLLDIVTTVLMINIRILTDDISVDLEVPQLYTFIHRCYIFIARELWSSPELLNTEGSSSKLHKNYQLVMKIIQTGINDAIQFYLPMKPILNQYLRTQNSHDNDYDNISLSDSDESIEEEVSIGSDGEEENEEISSMVVEPSNHGDQEDTSTFFEDASDIDVDIE